MPLLQHDLIIVDQVTSFMSNDFEIHDGAGAHIGTILTSGSAVSRFFMGSRELTVTDETGTVVRVVDTIDFGRDRYELTAPHDQPLGTVVQRIAFFAKKLSIELVDGSQLQLEGSFFEREFDVTGPQGGVARVSRSWAGIGAALLGHNRYAVGFAPQVPFAWRAAVIGAVVALDLIRAKESNSSS